MRVSHSCPMCESLERFCEQKLEVYQALRHWELDLCAMKDLIKLQQAAVDANGGTAEEKSAMESLFYLSIANDFQDAEAAENAVIVAHAELNAARKVLSEHLDLYKT